MKKILQYACIGIGYGSFFYLMILLYRQGIAPTRESILATLFMSALIGISAILFDIEKLNFLSALIIHFICTLSLAIGIMFYNEWADDIMHDIEFWLIFIIIYVSVWAISCISNSLRVGKINRALSKKRAKKGS
ncbi:hypothetical protein TH5N_06110 [Tetragenococcus halophilus]|uniref:DUF3021 domain-containing protein n=1 Tax=Tetragenococcus halophilus TaxID=51669 RepID=UPI0019276D76|nr:DUF3021 domain-containing protein [Tetragenococcus halophilus]GEQ37485.1 hypothetical protein TH3N_06110 [Tetragenococcus halophilus]GEQ39733.1 hypothetical protein TH5N_06110 [Tetragenococcus halophilus]GEQ42198.1 hypothetical protein TH6N_08240 [Tetragenococcus halophilus]GEQ44120.1 hypothetical protein TH8N_04900 [Tetragenococcus halophilus]GEQ46403.1 hypothetical protein TH9N_05160 [Tetragenococcus halophilus]